MLCLSRNSIDHSCTILFSTFYVKGRWEIGWWFLGSVLQPFLKCIFSFTILQASENLLEEIDRLHGCVIGMTNDEALFFGKIPERSLMPGVLLSSKIFSILNTLSNSVFEIVTFPSNCTSCDIYSLIVYQNYLEIYLKVFH